MRNNSKRLLNTKVTKVIAFGILWYQNSSMAAKLSGQTLYTVIVLFSLYSIFFRELIGDKRITRNKFYIKRGLFDAQQSRVSVVVRFELKQGGSDLNKFRHVCQLLN